jgi:uncharacterized protein YbcV (DUF1398 family)
LKTTNFFESMNELVMDSRFRSLTVTQNFESFLSSTGINEAENMHTFGWFLQPKGSHGLQDTFFKEFLTTAWTMVHNQTAANFQTFKTSKFFNDLSPVMFQRLSFSNAFVDREYTKTFACADMVITDIDSKVMVIVNNHFDKKTCDDAFAHFNSEKFSFFERKMFVTFDTEAHFAQDKNWMFMSNEWIINLCSNLIECPQYANLKVSSYLKDFYQFLTGSQYGTSHEQMAEYSASLVSDFHQLFTEFKNFKAEKVPTMALVDINPREFATTFKGQFSEKEYEVMSLYWSYKNTFNTFFELADLEAVTTDMTKMIDKKNFNFDRTFIRDGLRFTPFFEKAKNERAFFNRIFDVEMVRDMNKGLSLSLVINKDSWDKMTFFQRETIQKNFGFSGFVAKDRAVVWNRFYKQDWQKQNLSQEVVSLFQKVDQYFGTLGIQVA